MSASSDLDTGAVGDKIVRTADGAYICSGGAAPVLLAQTDRAWNLPVGSKISVASTGPVLFTANMRVRPVTDADSRVNWNLVTTTGLTTPMATVLAGLDTFNDLVEGAPTT